MNFEMKNITLQKILIVALVILMVVGVYFAFTWWQKSGDEKDEDEKNKYGVFEGFTEAEQMETCNIFSGSFINGEIITQEFGKQVVNSAKNTLKSDLGEQLFKKHYKYICGELSSLFPESDPDSISTLFQIKVVNKTLNFNVTQNVHLDIGIETLEPSSSGRFLREDAFLSEKWVSRDEVIEVFKSQVSNELKQIVDELEPDEITIRTDLRSYSSEDVGLQLLWTLSLGKRNSEFCQYYVLLVSSGKIVYKQECL